VFSPLHQHHRKNIVLILCFFLLHFVFLSSTCFFIMLICISTEYKANITNIYFQFNHKHVRLNNVYILLFYLITLLFLCLFSFHFGFFFSFHFTDIKIQFGIFTRLQNKPVKNIKIIKASRLR